MLCRQHNEVFSRRKVFGKILPEGWRFFHETPQGLDLAPALKTLQLPLPAKYKIRFLFIF